MTSFICNNSFAYVLRIIILDISETARGQGEGITTASRMHHQKKKRNYIRNLWLWLVCCSLLPTCYFHRPFTFRLVGFRLRSSLFSGLHFSNSSLKPVLNWANVCSPNVVRTVRRTLLRSQLACNEMQASARTCGRRAADSMIENVG